MENAKIESARDKYWCTEGCGMSVTKEQIETAKADIETVTRLNLGVIPLQDGQVLLDALTAAERERDEARSALAEYKRKAMHDSCPNCTGMKAATDDGF